MEHGLERRLVDSTLGNQVAVGDQIVCQIAVDLLLDLGEIVSRGGQADQRVYHSHGGDQHHQPESELGIQGSQHRSSRSSANLYPTPQTVRMYLGLAGSDSIFARSRLMCELTVCS